MARLNIGLNSSSVKRKAGRPRSQKKKKGNPRKRVSKSGNGTRIR